MKSTSRWTNGIIVSCNHSELCLPDVMPAIGRLADALRPDALIHLGDFLNTDCMRTGASEKEKSKDLTLDLETGLRFVKDFFAIAPRARTRMLFKGNHDVRPYQLLDHPNGNVRDHAKRVCADIDYAARKARADFVPYDIKHGWRQFAADSHAGHGFMYGVNAAREHANMIGAGNVVIGHLHRNEIASGQTLRPSKCYVTGWLGDENLADYARRRKATLGWNVSMISYATNGQTTAFTLHQRTEDGWLI